MKPKITKQPQDQTVVAGQRVQFSAAVASIPAATSIQWQFRRNPNSTWEAVPTDADHIGGKSDTTLTLVRPTVAFNGHQYHLIVANSKGAVISKPVTLTVKAAAPAPAARPAPPTPPPAPAAAARPTASTAATVPPPTRQRGPAPAADPPSPPPPVVVHSHICGLGWLALATVAILAIFVASQFIFGRFVLAEIPKIVTKQLSEKFPATSSAPTTSTPVAPSESRPRPNPTPQPVRGPQFRDVVLAPSGLGQAGCKEWYNKQGFSSREFWDEDSQTCH